MAAALRPPLLPLPMNAPAPAPASAFPRPFADAGSGAVPSANTTAPVRRPASLEELWALLQDPCDGPASADGAARPALRHLGQRLVYNGLVSIEQVQAALRLQQQQKSSGQRCRPLGQLLVEAGALSAEQLRAEIAAWLGQHIIDPSQLTPDPEALALVPRARAEQLQVLPLGLQGDAVAVLLDDPGDYPLLDQLRFMTQRRAIALQAAPGTLAPAIARAYRAHSATGGVKASAHDLAVSLGSSTDAPSDERSDIVSESDNTLVRLVHSIIEEAIALGASDIHIETEPAPRRVRVRLRIDGNLRPYLDLEARFRFALVARIKIMATLDISEHRKPQDGKIDFSRFGGLKVELRVATIPTYQGLEDVVLRVLASQKPLPLDSVGLSHDDLTQLRAAMRHSYGLILVCGPTGSGKTTTLHSVLSEINTDERKIWTAEDPIEITQRGLRQVEVNPRIGWTFAAAMRAFLRADPDVVMIGEMRDAETAGIAIEASLTGHLVLSTLHTNSAPESVTRLLEIGLEPFTFSDALIAILSQRLVRRLCKHCRAPAPVTAEALGQLADLYLQASHGALDVPMKEARTALISRWLRQLQAQQGEGQTAHLWHRVGCQHCEHTGYKGRMGLYELMTVNEAIRSHIRQRAPAQEIRASALRAGMKTLRQDGIEKVLQGLTDLPEVLAAANL